MRALLDQSVAFQHKALNVHAYRQELLASNIANADTPYYKARDVDFRGALQNVLADRKLRADGTLALRRDSERHLSGVDEKQGLAGVLDGYSGYRNEWQASVDGNTVEMDVERAAFAENSVHYEASLRFINSLFQGMQRAISGQL